MDTVAPLRLRKIKEKSPTLWYNEHTRSSRENGAQLEENKTGGISYCLAGEYPILQKSIKNAISDYFSSLLEEKNIISGIYAIQWQN